MPLARGSMLDSSRSEMQDAGVGGTVAGASRLSRVVVLAAIVVTAFAGVMPARAGARTAATGRTATGPPPGDQASSARRLSGAVRDRVPQIDPEHVVARFRPGYDVAKHAARAGAHIRRPIDGTR